ncbi:MAG: hypothetical protein H8K06_12945 [Nitrospira sp.]|uniref:Uncharacterized protein n=1 Tax=Nitrospira defluvii TaxID=330214 RepID=A0ABM8QC36_9BACT|nr:hypothetical protein [Nitrospira defluvii]MCS6327977.1 hypothetical protein [Nitrospira sp.]CAE6688713.1 conserved membrane hypothetical protein [Nitrospira defluvii]
MSSLTMGKSSRLRVLTRLGFWFTLLVGFLLPWAIMLGVDTWVHQVPFSRAWRSFTLHLFAPGYNLFLVGVLTAIPFVILAIMILLHLGTIDSQKALIAHRRALGLLSAEVVMLAIAGWTHISVLIYPDAQGALAYFYLPALLLLSLPVGYGLGRALAKALLPRVTT